MTSANLLQRYSDPHMDTKTKEQLWKDTRDIQIGNPSNFFPENTISTTKYTLANFFFKNLFEQMSKLANIYFLVLSALQVIPEISTSDGFPTFLPPLVTIMLLTMVKDAFEDYKRYKSDLEENNKETHVYKDGQFVSVKWKDVRVGDLLKISKNEAFPADMVLLASSFFKKGQCFIETKNLDGETNLKSKFVSDDLKSQITSDQDALRYLNQILNSEGPNQYLSKFQGAFVFGQSKVPLGINNFLLRGCSLRNTDYVFGCVVYTG